MDPMPQAARPTQFLRAIPFLCRVRLVASHTGVRWTWEPVAVSNNLTQKKHSLLLVGIVGASIVASHGFLFGFFFWQGAVICLVSQ